MGFGMAEEYGRLPAQAIGLHGSVEYSRRKACGWWIKLYVWCVFTANQVINSLFLLILISLRLISASTI